MLAGPVPELLKWFGPLEGDHEAGLVRSDAAMLDFSVETTVTNPKTREQNWNYLLILRGSEADMENPNREPLDGEGVEFNPHDSINGFDPSPGAPNHIRVIAIDDQAWVIVNGVLGQTVDLRGAWRAGEVAFLNRPQVGSGASGEVTFEEFQGLELRPLFGPEDGQLEPVPGRIATHDSGVFAKDFVADATFTRSQTQWDYGFKFRAAGGDPDVSDQYEAVGITFRGSWYHYRWQQGVGFNARCARAGRQHQARGAPAADRGRRHRLALPRRGPADHAKPQAQRTGRRGNGASLALHGQRRRGGV